MQLELPAGCMNLDLVILSPPTFATPLSHLYFGFRAVDLVLSGAKTNAFCCIRPPGHRAEPAAYPQGKHFITFYLHTIFSPLNGPPFPPHTPPLFLSCLRF